MSAKSTKLSPTLDAVLVVDDEESVRQSLVTILEKAGFSVDSAENGHKALEKIQSDHYNFILCDILMPECDGLQFLALLREEDFSGTVIMMSAYGSLDSALEAMKLGAYDYISKPFNADEIVLTLRKAQERERLRTENEFLRSQVTRRYSFTNIIANSPSMLEIFETVKKVADYKTTVLIYGESGTGKELIARALHYNSSRKNKRFVAINCGAIPENLLESELFGHKRGAFTDATRDKRGLFEEADGGTLLLDEVGELPRHLQVKLLRVLQEGQIRPVGDNKIFPVDVRVIAATLRNLEQDVNDGRFRDDLFYRLNVVSINVPPLCERKEDIPVLINYFLKRNQEKLGLPVYGIEKDAMAALIDYPWPGNIRELENCIERAMILTEGESITFNSLPGNIRQNSSPLQAVSLPTDDLSIKSHTRLIEENLIRRALEKTGGNRTHAAKLLEISHRTLLYKLKEYNLDAKKEELSDLHTDS